VEYIFDRKLTYKYNQHIKINLCQRRKQRIYDGGSFIW